MKPEIGTFDNNFTTFFIKRANTISKIKQGLLKFRTGTWYFDSHFMERVKICYKESGGHFEHYLKKSHFLFTEVRYL